jgi:hypothetical protein
VSDWAELFLGVIAAATLVTAIAQVGVLVAAGRLARRIERLTDKIDRELTPFFEHVNAIGRDASRAAALAAAQVERADQLFADLVQRVDRLMNTVQTAVGGTAREGAAILAGFRAALTVIRQTRASRARARAEDEDGLFI